MIRRISSLALGIAFTFAAATALAEEPPAEGGGEAPAGGEEKPAGGEAAAGGEAKAAAAVDTSAPPDAGGKIKLGLRLGYMLPMGEFSKNNKMSDGISGGIPLWLDLGYMVSPNIMVGLYAQYAYLMVKNCPSGATCSGSDLRFGVQGQYHLSPGESMNPWVGLGVGYEMLNTSAEASGAEAKGNYKGLEFANIQGGADFKVGSMAVGPFLSFSLGQYSSGEVTEPNVGTVEGDITDKAMHEWLLLGVKGTMGF